MLPILVVLSELLRAAPEQFRGRLITVEQLDQGRRACTIVAAVLFAGGGFVLAAIVDVSFHLQLVDIVHVRWRPLVMAAHRNRARARLIPGPDRTRSRTRQGEVMLTAEYFAKGRPYPCGPGQPRRRPAT